MWNVYIPTSGEMMWQIQMKIAVARVGIFITGRMLADSRYALPSACSGMLQNNILLSDAVVLA